MELGGKHYVLLPKLGGNQIGLVEEGLRSRGFSIRESRGIIATRKGVVVKVFPIGYASSTSDLTDFIAPIIPELLKSPKETVAAKELVNQYITLDVNEPKRLRITPRLESGSTWNWLRRLGLCALTPDEHLILKLFLSRARTCSDLLTDFPTRSSRVRVLGTRQFYESALESSDAASSLRSLGHKGERNSYLPRSGILGVEGFTFPSDSELTAAFNDVGDWSSFHAS